MPKITYGDLKMVGLGVAYLCSMDCASFLSLKLRRIRRALRFAIEDYDEEKKKFYDKFGKKDKEDELVMEELLEAGKAVLGRDEKPIMVVVIDKGKDEEFEEALKGLDETEIEIEEFVTAEDIEDERHPKSFCPATDKFDLLGNLFFDEKDGPEKAKPRKGRGSGKPGSKPKSDTPAED